MTSLVCFVAILEFVQVITRYILEIPVMGLEEIMVFPALWMYMKGAAAMFEGLRWDRAEVDQANFVKKLADNGTTIVEVSDAEIDATAAKVRKDVWPVILKDVGEDWGKPILDAASK